MHSSSSVSVSSSSLSEILDRFERLTKSSGENERALRLATRALCQECVESKKIKIKKENENEEGTRIRSRDEKSLLRRCFLHESRVVVDEISRRVCDLVEHNVVDKEVVTSELLAALEATSDGTKGRFLVRGIYDICVSNSNINGSGTFATAKGGEDGYDDSTYMPLYRAMKSGGAHVCSTFLYYATLKEKDIERFQRLFYRTILERNVSGAMVSTSSSLLPGLARVALVRDGSFAALEILTKCLPWYKCSSAEDVSWVSEAIADIADWCEMKVNDNNKKTEEEDRINTIVERAELGAMAQLCDAVKKGEDVVSLSFHTHRILRISRRDSKTNALAACDLISNCVGKLSIEDQSSLFSLTQTCVRSYPDVLRMHLLELSATLSENHLGESETAYNAAEQGSFSSFASDISERYNIYPLTECSVLHDLCQAIESNQTMALETKESIFEHALRRNEENDALFTLACMFSPISLRVRKAALDSVRTRFRKRPELAISGLPIVSLALASIEKNFLVSPPPAQDVALATLRGLKAAASSASHPLSANAALRTLLPIVEHIDNEEDEERSLALDLVLLAEAWISAPSSGSQLSFRFQQAIERAIASHIFEETLAGAKAMLEVSKADPFRAAETFANAIQTCIEQKRPSCCRAIGLETIEVLFQAEALDFYPAFKIVTKEMPTRPKDSNLVAKRWLRLLKYGVEDADVVPEAGSLVVNALIDCALDQSKTTDDSLRIEAWSSLNEFNIKQVKNLLNIYDGEDDNESEESKTSFLAFTRLVNTFIEEENEDVVRAASKVIARIVELESESVSRRARASQKKRISLIGGSSINQDEEKVLMEISDPFLYRLAIGTAKRLRKNTKSKDDELISPLLLLLLFDGDSYEMQFCEFVRRNKFSHAWWNEYVIENTMMQFMERWMVSWSNAAADDSKSKGERILDAGFFSSITGERLQSPDAIQTTRVATKIVDGFKSDAVSTRAREEIGILLSKCLRLGCSKLIFRSVTRDEEDSSAGTFFNDFNEQHPEYIFVRLASFVEAVGDYELALKLFANSIEYLEENDGKEDESSWRRALLCALPILARVVKEGEGDNNALISRAIKETLSAFLVEEQAFSLMSLGALASLALERGIPVGNALCEKIVTVLIVTAMDAHRKCSSEDRCSAVLGASALLGGSSLSWCWLPSPPKQSTVHKMPSSSLVDDANFFVRPLLFGRGQDLAKKLLKTLESISSSSAAGGGKNCRVGDIASLALGFASISARTLILSAGDVSKQHKSASVDATNNFGACSLRLLDSLFAVDTEFRKKSNALEALAALGRSIPLPNGDGPYQSLLRRYYGEKELVDSVVTFASSRPAKHIGGEIVNRTIADYKCAHNSIINNVNVLSAVRAAAKSEDVDLLRAALALHDQKCENDSDATHVLKHMWLGSLEINAATSFAETLLIELLRRTSLKSDSLKHATEGLYQIAANMAKHVEKDSMVRFSTTLREGCEDDVLPVLASRLVLLGVEIVRSDDLVLPLARWNTKRLRRDELLHFALDVREVEGFFEKQKLGARSIKRIFEFKKRLIDDACHLIKRISEDASTNDGEFEACSCLMLLCLRFGRKTNRGFIYAQIVSSSSWDFRKRFFPFALCTALEEEDDVKKKEKRTGEIFLFNAKTIVDSLVVPSASGENSTCARALREIMGKFDVKISLTSYESVARRNFHVKK